LDLCMIAGDTIVGDSLSGVLVPRLRPRFSTAVFYESLFAAVML